MNIHEGKGSTLYIYHARIQKVLSEVDQPWRFSLFAFLGREDPKTTISGPSSARERNAISFK